MKIFAMYSYKGGAGRTVSAANIAYLVAKEEKRKVLLIDCDLDGSGMQYVLQDKYRVPKFAVQDIFGDCVVSNRLDDNFWDNAVAEVDGSNGNLLFIPSRYAGEDVLPYTSSMERRWREFKLLAERKDIDCIIIDSASGLQAPATLSLRVSDVILFFMRWSDQFIEGTLRTLKMLEDKLPGGGGPRKILIPSAVPDLRESERFNKEMKRRKRRVNIELRDRSAEMLDDSGVPESPLLKWKESILCIENDLTEEDKKTLDAYRKISKKVVSLL